MNTIFPNGAHVVVAHGITGRAGVVSSSQPGWLTVSYGSARELVELSRHHVELVA